jgi:hypothetical protein
LAEDAVTISRIQQTVTVTIPAAMLKYVNIDTAATTFEETEHALLAFGDIKLSQEQQQELNVSIETAMREKLEEQGNIDAARRSGKNRRRAASGAICRVRQRGLYNRHSCE